MRKTQAQFGPIEIAPRLLHRAVVVGAADGRMRSTCGSIRDSRSAPDRIRPRDCASLAARHTRGGESLLDYGCGSGILAIAAAKLGAGHVIGVDVDPQAIRASAANAATTTWPRRFVLPDALRSGQFDIVVANILANPLMLLAPALCARVRAGGAIALSGVLGRADGRR